jgi:AraC family transcriptional regulator, arabinose operon regulatory protein
MNKYSIFTNFMERKSVGFTGERIIELPANILAECRKMPVISGIHIARMGAYPKAKGHFYQRPKGIQQTIIIYCSDGKGWTKIHNRKEMVKAGQVVFIPSGVPHSYGADKDYPWSIYWFHLAGNCNDEVINTVINPDHGFVHTDANPAEKVTLFSKICDALTTGFSKSSLMYANLTFRYFLATFIDPLNGLNPKKATADKKVAHFAVELMLKNVDNLLTVEQMANAAQLSVSFFCRKFKQETGYTPVEYFNNLKIQKACQLLHFSNMRINEVAFAIGITDPFYFSRLFKKQLGISPLDYRIRENAVKKE